MKKLIASFEITLKKGDKVVTTDNDGNEMEGEVVSVEQPNPNGYGFDRQGTINVLLSNGNNSSWSPERVAKVLD